MVFIVAAIGVYRHFLTATKEVALKGELRNLRAVIAFCYGVHGKYPENIQDMRMGGYISYSRKDTPVKKGYMISLIVDDEGYPLDPFGNRYVYDKITGEVKSGTKGYEKW